MNTLIKLLDAPVGILKVIPVVSTCDISLAATEFMDTSSLFNPLKNPLMLTTVPASPDKGSNPLIKGAL